jgi:hypothetical protein
MLPELLGILVTGYSQPNTSQSCSNQIHRTKKWFACPKSRETVPAQPVEATLLWSFDLTIRFKGMKPFRLGFTFT